MDKRLSARWTLNLFRMKVLSFHINTSIQYIVVILFFHTNTT